MMQLTDALPVDKTSIHRNAELAIRYQPAKWDALIAAAAMLAGCDTRYPEELRNGQGLSPIRS